MQAAALPAILTLTGPPRCAQSVLTAGNTHHLGKHHLQEIQEVCGGLVEKAAMKLRNCMNAVMLGLTNPFCMKEIGHS